MIDRRTLVALAATFPLAGRQFQLDTPEPNVNPLETDGVQVLGISPDGSKLVGLREPEQICFLDSTTGEVLIETKPLAEINILDPDSLAWSPDSSHLAFSLIAEELLRDSDIFIVDASSGEITNATTEGFDTPSDALRVDVEVHVDTYPAWLDNETLVFGRRTNPLREELPPVDLMQLSWPDMVVDHWVNLLETGTQRISGPIHALADGRLVTYVHTEEREAHVTLIDPDGEVTFLNTETIAAPFLADANETHCLVFDQAVATDAIWIVPYDGASEAKPIQEVFELNPHIRMRSRPAFGPEPDSMVMVVGEDPTVTVWEGDIVRELGTLSNDAPGMRCFWSGDIVLVAAPSAAWTIDAT